jgi:hypothetical protein
MVRNVALCCAVILGLLLPLQGITCTCVSYSTAYALQAQGATGTLTRVQQCNNDHYTITSQINVSKFFISKQITQTATGLCNTENFSPLTFAIDNNGSTQSTALSPSVIDTLSLPLFLSNAVASGVTTFASMSLLYNGNTIAVQCATPHLEDHVISNSGANIAATAVTCTSADNTLVLKYFFKQNVHNPVMIAANVVENNATIFSAVINNE